MTNIDSDNLPRYSIGFLPEEGLKDAMDEAKCFQVLRLKAETPPDNGLEANEFMTLEYRKHIIDSMVGFSLAVIYESDNNRGSLKVYGDPRQTKIMEEYGAWADKRSGLMTPSDPTVMSLNPNIPLRKAYMKQKRAKIARCIGLIEVENRDNGEQRNPLGFRIVK